MCQGLEGRTTFTGSCLARKWKPVWSMWACPPSGGSLRLPGGCENASCVHVYKHTYMCMHIRARPGSFICTGPSQRAGRVQPQQLSWESLQGSPRSGPTRCIRDTSPSFDSRSTRAHLFTDGFDDLSERPGGRRPAVLTWRATGAPWGSGS